MDKSKELEKILKEIIKQAQSEVWELHFTGTVKRPEKDIYNYYIPEIMKLFEEN